MVPPKLSSHTRVGGGGVMYSRPPLGRPPASPLARGSPSVARALLPGAAGSSSSGSGGWDPQQRPPAAPHTTCVSSPTPHHHHPHARALTPPPSLLGGSFAGAGTPVRGTPVRNALRGASWLKVGTQSRAERTHDAPQIAPTRGVARVEGRCVRRERVGSAHRSSAGFCRPAPCLNVHDSQRATFSSL